MTQSTPNPTPAAPQPIDSEKLRKELTDMLKKAGAKVPQQPSSGQGGKSPAG